MTTSNNNNTSSEIERLRAELEIMTDKREASRRLHLDLRSERDELLGQLEVMTNKHTGRVKDVERLRAEATALYEACDWAVSGFDLVFSEPRPVHASPVMRTMKRLATAMGDAKLAKEVK